MADIERLEEVVGFLESHPELHNQQIWMGECLFPAELALRYPELTETECGSAGCLAGWTVHFWGDKQAVRSGFLFWDVESAKVLGLMSEEADILFHSRNTIDDLREMVKDLANGLDLMETWEEVTTNSFDRDGNVVVVDFYRRVAGA